MNGVENLCELDFNQHFKNSISRTFDTLFYTSNC